MLPQPDIFFVDFDLVKDRLIQVEPAGVCHAQRVNHDVSGFHPYPGDLRVIDIALRTFPLEYLEELSRLDRKRDCHIPWVMIFRP